MQQTFKNAGLAGKFIKKMVRETDLLEEDFQRVKQDDGQVTLTWTEESEMNDTATEAPVEQEEKESNVKNGIAHPSAGTKAAEVWELVNEISRELGRPPKSNEVITAAFDRGMRNYSTVAAEYGNWKKFYGVTAEDLLTDEEKQAREDRKIAAEEARARREARNVDRVIQNDIKQPLPDTKASEIWALLDQATAEMGHVPKPKEFVDYCADKSEHKPNSLIGEHYLWRKFHGHEVARREARPITAEEIQVSITKVKDRIQKDTDRLAKLEAQLAEIQGTENAA